CHPFRGWPWLPTVERRRLRRGFRWRQFPPRARCGTCSLHSRCAPSRAVYNERSSASSFTSCKSSGGETLHCKCREVASENCGRVNHVKHAQDQESAISSYASRPCAWSSQEDFRMSKTRLIEDRPRWTYRWYRGACGVFVVVLGALLSSTAQVRLPPPPQLEPTINALGGIQRCAQNIAGSASDISAKLLDAQTQLTYGLLKGGYANAQSGGGGYGKNGEWSIAPPPKEYVEDLSHEASWCLEVAHILNTDPAKKEAALKVLASIANDLHIKVTDCRKWG